jgi:hypothetical protein
MNVDITVFFENLSRKYKFHYNRIKITRALHGNQYKFWPYLAQFFSEGGMFQSSVVEKIKIYILCSIFFFQKSCRLWDKVEKYCRAGWHYGACALCAGHHRLQNTHSEFVIFIAFPRQQYLHKDPQYYVIGTLFVLITFL